SQRTAECDRIDFSIHFVLVRRAQIVSGFVQERADERFLSAGSCFQIGRLAEQGRHLYTELCPAVGITIKIRHRHRAAAGFRDRAPVGQRLADRSAGSQLFVRKLCAAASKYALNAASSWPRLAAAASSSPATACMSSLYASLYSVVSNVPVRSPFTTTLK